jgi:integrase
VDGLLEYRDTEITTTARDHSIMRTHVLPQWGSWQLAKIDHLAVQTWISKLGKTRSRATVAECYRLTSAVLRSAVRNRLIPFNPATDVRVPRRRREDKHDQLISRLELQRALLPVVPARHRAIVATAAGAGLRWGEAAGLRGDALDLDGHELQVVRTVVEVGGHTSFKSFPKSAAGRRIVPLPPWLVTIIREHLHEWPAAADAPVFANEVGGPLRRTQFRARVWRPALVRAGLLGTMTSDEGGHHAQWTDRDGTAHKEWFKTEPAADNSDRILRALSDDDDPDDEDGPAGV